MGSKQLLILIEDYIMDLKKRVNPNSVPNYINPIQLFLDVNEFDLNWKKIRRLFPQKIKNAGRKPYMNQDIKKMLNYARSKRTTALIHFLASTGCRVGSIPELQIKHLKKIDDDCYSILFYEETTEEYVSFLTHESSKYLLIYGVINLLKYYIKSNKADYNKSKQMDTNENMTNIVNETLSRNKVLEDRNKEIIQIAEETLQELDNSNTKLVKIRKICLDDEQKIMDHCAQIKFILME